MPTEVYSAFGVTDNHDIFEGASADKDRVFEEFMKWSIARNVEFAYLSSYSIDKAKLKIWNLEVNEIGFIPVLITKGNLKEFMRKNKEYRGNYNEFIRQIAMSYLTPYFTHETVKIDFSFGYIGTIRVFNDLKNQPELFQGVFKDVR